MFRIRIWYADFGVVMASRVWRGRRALGLSVRVARLAGPGAAPAWPGAAHSNFLLFRLAVQNARDGAAHTPPVAPRTLCEPRHAHGDTRRHARRRAAEEGRRQPACAQIDGTETRTRVGAMSRCQFRIALHATTARFSAGSCVTSGVPIASSFAPGFKPARTIGPSISSCQAHRGDEPHQVKGAASKHGRGSASAHLENLSGDLWAVALKVNGLANAQLAAIDELKVFDRLMRLLAGSHVFDLLRHISETSNHALILEL
jgi:hypothetical protein